MNAPDKLTLQLVLNRGQAHHTTLVNQMLEFPTGRRDDGPDALEMAVRLVDMRAYGGAIVMGNVIW
jgi:hypothetical protein